MERIFPHNLHEHVAEVVVIFVEAGKSEILTTKTGSANHFFERFSIGDDDIQLRLDWSQLDHNGFPTLDANFFNRDTGKRRTLKGKRRNAHHTVATFGEHRIYEWEFDGYGRQIKVTITWRAAVVERLRANDSCDATVIRAAGQIAEP
jgi:hypothetical protein